MKSPKKKPLAAKLRNWRVAIMRARAQGLETVAAPDHKSAEAEAVKAFGLSVKRWNRPRRTAFDLSLRRPRRGAEMSHCRTS
jgi:hypothetical protein